MVDNLEIVLHLDDGGTLSDSRPWTWSEADQLGAETGPRVEGCVVVKPYASREEYVMIPKYRIHFITITPRKEED